jgi:hypothetical protein
MSTARARIAVAAAVSAVVAVALSGCAVFGGLLPHTRSASAKPAVGDCWVSTFDTAQHSAAWTASGSVPCTSRHQLYTFAVVSVTSSASTWRDSSTHGLNDQIANDAFDACDRLYADEFPGAPDQGRLTEYFFVAPEAQWKTGARWVRCDLGVFRTGSLFESPDFASLPSDIRTLKKQLDTTPGLFASCVTTTDPSGDTGPLDDPKAVIADCTRNYQWRFEGVFTIPGADGDPYPDDNTLNKATQADCGDIADEAETNWAGYVPTQDNWDAGDRLGSCWFAPVSAPQT